MNNGNEILLNVFQQQDARGREDGKINFNKFDCIYKPTNTETTLTAGDMVKLSNGGNKVMPTVSKLIDSETYNADVMYGFVPLARKANLYNDGDVITVAWSGCHMRMMASNTINCGDVVYYEIAQGENFGKVLATNNPTATQIKCGIAKTSAEENQLLTVIIK